MTSLNELTLAQARDAIATKKVSAVELAQAHLDAMEKARGLGAYIAETPDVALAMARESDKRIASGSAGPLEGLPIGVKDLYATKGVHTQACSHILDGFKPAYESTVTAQLWRDGAVMLGKLNMDEFAMGSSNETSFYGPVASPWLPPGWSADKARAALGSKEKKAPQAVRPPRSPRICAWAPPLPTPAAPSASPPPSRERPA
jgi:aspartyl-tRNA(Asn)/glutamyl-tRNA(Gln) amidotransferase subunit A